MANGTQKFHPRFSFFSNKKKHVEKVCRLELFMIHSLNRIKIQLTIAHNCRCPFVILDGGRSRNVTKPDKIHSSFIINFGTKLMDRTVEISLCLVCSEVNSMPGGIGGMARQRTEFDQR